MAIEALQEIQEYRKLGTIEELKASVKKVKPKKPDLQQIEVDCYEHDCYMCPECGSFIGYAIECKEENYQKPYCENCGQKLDWSDLAESER
jgi:hypothetical protein